MLRQLFFDASALKLAPRRCAVLAGILLIFGLSSQAETVQVAFVGYDTYVQNGQYYVLPYQLNVDGTVIDATCYDIFDDVNVGQTWEANVLTVDQAAANGQFSSWFGDYSDALNAYERVGFLSHQATYSAQDQIDLQQDIWNVFAPGTYGVTTGMQGYLNLLTTAAFANFDFNTVRFLEEVNQGSGRAQAFVIDPSAGTPEPGTVMLLGTGLLLVGVGRIRRKSVR